MVWIVKVEQKLRKSDETTNELKLDLPDSSYKQDPVEKKS